MRDLQRQLAAVQQAQAAALAAATSGGAGDDAALTPGQLVAMRQQLAAAQAALQTQSKELEAARGEYQQRKELLREAAGAARREVLTLQSANSDLQAMADRLQQQNELLAAQLRSSGSGPGSGGSGGSRPGSAASGGEPAAATGGSAGPSPAKRHMDATLLQAMIRKQDGCAPTGSTRVFVSAAGRVQRRRRAPAYWPDAPGVPRRFVLAKRVPAPHPSHPRPMLQGAVHAS